MYNDAVDPPTLRERSETLENGIYFTDYSPRRAMTILAVDINPQRDS